MSDSSSVDFERVFDIIGYQQKKYPQDKALNIFRNGRWSTYSIMDVQHRTNSIALWLVENGFKKGDRVVVMPRMGTPEWMIVDLGCQKAGLVVVPVHPTSTSDEIAFILRETEAVLFIAADNDLKAKAQSAGIQMSHLYQIDTPGAGHFPPLGEGMDGKALDKLVERQKQVAAGDTVAILYTSGTTGGLKGVVLSHANIVSNIKSILPILPLEPSHRVLSFLPFSHIFERTACYSYLAFGTSIYFSHSRDSIAGDFVRVRPFFCTSVPRTLEKMYDVLHQQRINRNFIKRRIISWAIGVGHRYKDKGSGGWLFGAKLFLARVLVLNIWRNRLGGKIRYIAVGAAALRPEISRLFSSAGVKTLSGYGMTEASPFITVNRPGLYRFGTVGVPVPGVEIRITDPDEAGEGEILVKGPNIMAGYFLRPELNLETFDHDGWLRTGDIGKIVHKRFLAITDRKKDIFKTSAGKYIAPQQVENHFTLSPFILQCMIVGFNRPFVTAVVVPNFPVLQTWCTDEGIHWTSPPFMVHNIKVVKKMQDEVNALNSGLLNFQQVKGFVLADEEWTVESKELSASFKLVRQKLLERYRGEVEKLYAGNG